MIKRVTLKDWSYADMQDFKQMEIHPDGSVFFFSTHQYPHYPGTGRATETGIGAGEGFTLNLPLSVDTESNSNGAASLGGADQHDVR